MPVYGTAVAPNIKVFTPGHIISLLDGTEGNLTAGLVTERFVLHRDQLPVALSVEIAFSGAPGNFQIDLQTSDTDNDNYFTTKQSVDQTVLNAHNVCRLEATNIVAKYVRLKVVSIANGVTGVATAQ